MAEPLTAEQLLQSIWMALRRIEDNMALPPAPLELPPISIAPPDLADVVNAVTALKPGPTAEEIAAAIAATLRPGTGTPDGSAALESVAAALEKLDFRLKGMGTQAYGGGSVSLTPQAATMIGDAVQATTLSTVVTAVAATTSVVELGANRAARSAMTVFCEPGSAVMYLKFGTGASAADYSNQLAAGDYWESSPPKYTGPVTAVWAAATGRALVTEFLP